MIHKGQFVKVGKDFGVVVFLEYENNTPEEHLGIRYGELSDNGNPLYRTVPSEYCKLVDESELGSYH